MTRARGRVLALGVVVAAAVAASGFAAVRNLFGGSGADEAAPGRTDPRPFLLPPPCESVYYERNGLPRLLIASDLPLRGLEAVWTGQMTQAIKLVLKRRDFRAGPYTVGYVSCDDAGEQGGWSPRRCAANARLFAGAVRVVGVVGALESACARASLRTLNRAPRGPLALVSPAATDVGLTRAGAGARAGEPGSHYPTGRRNFVRLRAPDDAQAAADALLARRLGAERVAVLDDGSVYGRGLATAFGTAAAHAGLAVVASEAWRPGEPSFERLAQRVAAAHPDAVFLGGLVGRGGGRLIVALRRVLGPKVALILPDGFTPVATVVEEAGSAANGAYVSVPWIPVERLGPGGRRFVDEFERTLGSRPDELAVYAGQAAELLLDAIAASDGTRARVTAAVLGTRADGAILGSFSFDADGDITVAPVAIQRIERGRVRVVDVLTPPRP